MVFALQKDSELRAAFNYHLTSLHQAGVNNRLSHNWLEEGRPSDMSDRIFIDEASVLGYDNLFFPALIVSFGSASAIGLLILETLMSKNTRLCNFQVSDSWIS